MGSPIVFAFKVAATSFFLFPVKMNNSAINIVTDQEMNAQRMKLRERREIISGTFQDKNVATLIHTRWIDAKMYQVIATVQDGVVNNSVKTELSENEVLEFEQIWKDNWYPQLSDERAQMSEQEWQKMIELSRDANKKSDARVSLSDANKKSDAEGEKLHQKVQIQDVK